MESVLENLKLKTANFHLLQLKMEIVGSKVVLKFSNLDARNVLKDILYYLMHLVEKELSLDVPDITTKENAQNASNLCIQFTEETVFPLDA